MIEEIESMKKNHLGLGKSSTWAKDYPEQMGSKSQTQNGQIYRKIQGTTHGERLDPK